MRRNGFTLIELLAVIIIFAIILAIAVPNIIQIINRAKNDVYYQQEKLLVGAAQKYLVNSGVYIPQNTGEFSIIPLADLKEKKLIDNILISKQVCDGYIKIVKSSETSYDYLPYLKCGDRYVTDGYQSEVNRIGNAVLHLDAMSIDNLNDGDKISQWKDLSGLNNHANQTAEANKPKFTYINGLPIVESEDANVNTGDSLILNDNARFRGSSLTFVAVLWLRNYGQSYIIGDSTASTINWRMRTHNTGTWAVDWKDSLGANYSVGGTNYHDWPVGQIAIFTLIWDVSDTGEVAFKAYKNNELKFELNHHNGFNNTPSNKRLFARGDIWLSFVGGGHEVIIFDKAINDRERNMLYEYLAEKWLDL
jgi:prepilin-type N-terminal cleavage/methylation domain-containing protein